MNAAQRRNAVLASIIQWKSMMGYPNVDPYLVLAQSALETGDFTSRRIVEDNNAFGMMHPSVRETTSIGGGTPEPGYTGEFARYTSLEQSVRDYFMRQRYFNVPDSSNAAVYVDATVASGYAGSDTYGAAWMEKYGETDRTPPGDTGGGGSGSGSNDSNDGALLLGLAVVGYAVSQ